MSVAGTVTGDVLGLGTGDHRVTVARGGTVTVGRTGRIASIKGIGICSETGDLSATVAGVVAGDVLALGSGEHRVTVAAGGAVTGMVRVATESAVMVEGTVGRGRLDRGGMVTVSKDGRVTGLAGDDADTAVIHSESGVWARAEASGESGGDRRIGQRSRGVDGVALGRRHVPGRSDVGDVVRSAPAFGAARLVEAGCKGLRPCGGAGGGSSAWFGLGSTG